ncbi:MAG: putative quinol monooxygenase, partial [Vibrio sp.]
MSQLTIVANIVAKETQIDLVKSELLKLIPITQKEAGCLQYNLHQDNQNPAHFVFIEKWESKAHLDTHLKGPHLAAYSKAVEGAVVSFTIQ